MTNFKILKLIFFKLEAITTYSNFRGADFYSVIEDF